MSTNLTHRVEQLEKELNEVKGVLDKMRTHSFFQPYFGNSADLEFKIGSKVVHKGTGLEGVIYKLHRRGYTRHETGCNIYLHPVWKVRCELEGSHAIGTPAPSAIVFGFWDEDLLRLVK